MRFHVRLPLAVLLGMGLLSACRWDAARVLAIDATGSVRGTAFIGEGTSYLPESDVPLPGVRLALVRGGRDVVAHATSAANGSFRFGPVPIGTYRLDVDPLSLGDSLQSSADPAAIEVTASDSTGVVAAFTFRTIPIDRARAAKPSSRLTVAGVALNAPLAFGNSLLHVMDESGAIRVADVPAIDLQAGDSVRIRGTMSLIAGQPTLTDVQLRRLGSAPPPVGRLVSTGEAATADDGALDARLVRVTNSSVLDATSNGEETVYRVDDGSGVLEVRARGFPAHRAGSFLEATGVLTPHPSVAMRWVLFARESRDLVSHFLRATTAEARALPVGRLVQISGVALSAWGPFGTPTIHIGDATGALRVLDVPQKFVEPGYNIEVVGSLGSDEGHRVLRDATVTVLSTGTPPHPVAVSAAAAASAADGRLDAQLVRVSGLAVGDTATVLGDLHLGVHDGTGSDLTIVLSRSIGFPPERFAPGVVLDADGLLIPRSTGEWMLFPRSLDDVRFYTRSRAGPD